VSFAPLQLKDTELMKQFMTRREVAAYLTERGLPTTYSTLTKLAHTGGGPDYQMWGNKAVSTQKQADDYIAAKLSAPRRSTSEAA
jgi:hypothetical protein